MTRPVRICAWRPLGIGALLVAAAVAGVVPASAQQLAFEDVVANLKVGDPRVRMDALKMLRDAGYLEAAPAIAPLLSDPVPEIQALAIETEVALFLVDENYTREFGKGLIKAKGATLPLYAFAQGSGATIANLPPIGIFRGLVFALSSPAAQTRFNAAYALGVLAPPAIIHGAWPEGKAALDHLMELIRDPDPTLRLAATHVLGRLLGAALHNAAANADMGAMRTDVGDQIIAGMNDPDELIRLSSMGALGEMRHERAVQALTDTFGYYKRDRFGMAALDALAQIAHPGSLTVFTALLENNDPQVRRLAVEGIGRARDKVAMANLETRMAREKSSLVLQAVAFAKARHGDFGQLARIVEGLKSATLRSFAFDYLAELGGSIAPSLVGFAAHKDEDIRAGVAEVLGIIGNQTSLLTLDSLAADKSRVVSSAAERSRKRLALRTPAQPR